MRKIKNYNLVLFIPLLILNIISLFNMINSKYISTVYNNAFIKQLIWFVLGYIILFLFQRIKIKNIFKHSKYLYLFSLFLLILVLFLGNDINGAKCWLNIFGFSFQPSEIMKLALPLYLIEIATNSKKETAKDEFLLITKLCIITLIPSILVFLEPDTGAIINYLIILLVILFYIKLNKWWYISFFSISIFLVIIFFIMYFFFQDYLVNLIGTSLFYRMDRLINFANGSSYQLENALITIGSSSFFGEGINKILLYIPEAPTDFFFAFSIGNYGVFSAIIILISFLIIDLYLIYKTNNLKNVKYKMFITSYLGIFIFHQIYNISMNVGLLPIMGIPLPFLSYGGTNTLINYLFLGIILKLFKEKTSIK
ncbi:MAG: FtsW/RodA/SpoVE family cell cycle protein [Bacilli bacterium]|nr:FtsW/RodA/SpoVE family cell cycle protein [Bacilli bacterium]